MKKPLNKEKIEEALSLIGELLERKQSESFRIIVCGGSALLVTGLRRETTKDVDILAFLNEKSDITESPDLPDDLKEAAKSVSIEMNLDEHWLNTGPSSIINPNLPNSGLPDGFLERLTKREYGPKLTVYYISRIDQVHLLVLLPFSSGTKPIDDLI